jgi:phage N-6-adenine-methyltransferase
VRGDDHVNTAVHFSSATDQWATPQEFFDNVAEQWGPFDLDVCADETNAKCSSYIDKETDGLVREWWGACWMNPPYGREIGKWVKKAAETGRAGGYVVALLPARTDTRWWHAFVHPVMAGLTPGAVFFVKGRLKFGNAKAGAPFPSVLVVFGTKPNRNALAGP